MSKGYTRAFRQKCNIEAIDQSDESRITVAGDLRCSYPFPYNFRQRTGDSVQDVQMLHVFVEPPGVEIKESMRIVFDEANGGDFRIHSINKWPKVDPEYYEIILHGEGSG